MACHTCGDQRITLGKSVLLFHHVDPGVQAQRSSVLAVNVLPAEPSYGPHPLPLLRDALGSFYPNVGLDRCSKLDLTTVLALTSLRTASRSSSSVCTLLCVCTCLSVCACDFVCVHFCMCEFLCVYVCALELAYTCACEGQRPTSSAFPQMIAELVLFALFVLFWDSRIID